jgi:hypothetical protein
MGRIFGILCVLAAVWAMAEIYTHGFDGAFGGILAGWNDPITQLPESDGRTLGQRVGDHVQGSLDDAYERRVGGAGFDPGPGDEAYAEPE